LLKFSNAQLGDPTTFNNLKPAREIVEAMKEIIDEGNFNGYAPSVGFFEARQAVADYSGKLISLFILSQYL
jgi:aspartate/methionine/tyrosine aminotransferase